MKSNFKKLGILFASFILVFCYAVLGSDFSSKTAEPLKAVTATSGTVPSDGEIQWVLSEKTLTIYGHGNINDFDNIRDTPWYQAGLYYNNTDIDNIVICDGITGIGKNVFECFYYIIDVSIANSVTFIDDYAFYNVGNWRSKPFKIQLSDHLEYIGDRCFYYANICGDINIPETCSYIGKYAFAGTKLNTVNISKPADESNFWGDYCFYDCANIVDVTFQEGITKVGRGAFYDCFALESIEFPQSMQNIESGAFGYDESITKIFYRGTNFSDNVTVEKWNEYINDPRAKKYTLFEDWFPKYVDSDGNDVCFKERNTYNILSAANNELTEGVWVVRTHEVKYDYASLEIKGNVTLILLNNCGIVSTYGINIHENKTLKIGSETIDMDNFDNMGYINVFAENSNCCGIGGIYDNKTIGIDIYGGRIESHGGTSFSGIGSGWRGTANINIYNGKIDAYGGFSGSGIGAGESGVSNINIYNGIVNGFGGNLSAGIGGGPNCDATINIHNGTVKGYCNSYYGAGIGTGAAGYAVINIYDGTVEGYGGRSSAGIGTGATEDSSHRITEINIYGGNVYGEGQDGSEDIGHGFESFATVNDQRLNHNNNTASFISAGSFIIISIICGVALITAGIFIALYFKAKRKI